VAHYQFQAGPPCPFQAGIAWASVVLNIRAGSGQPYVLIGGRDTAKREIQEEVHYVC
jgi:hypothetical protein